MSKKKLYCVILLVCLLCCACGKKEGYNALSYQVTENDTLFICDAEQWGNSRQTKLSNWVTDFKCIQLENSDTALVKGWKYISLIIILAYWTNRLSNCLIIKENSSAILDVQGKDQENTKCYMVLHSMKSSTKFALHRFMGNHSWNIISEENFFSQ